MFLLNNLLKTARNVNISDIHDIYQIYTNIYIYINKSKHIIKIYECQKKWAILLLERKN